MFKKEKIKDLHYSVTGLITADELQTAADEILTEYGKKAKMPGFRPGHIPLSILRQKYNTSATADAIDKLMNRDLNAYLADKKLRLAGSPRADLAKWEMGSDAEYTLEFDILPTMPSIDLEKITVTKKTTTLDEAQVEKALENLRKSTSVAEKQPADYVAQNGDTAVIDFRGFIGDEAFDGGARQDHGDRLQALFQLYGGHGGNRRLVPRQRQSLIFRPHFPLRPAVPRRSFFDKIYLKIPYIKDNKIIFRLVILSKRSGWTDLQ